MLERDNLHYSFRQIDGYNKACNFVMSPREPGKTTAMWLEKIYFKWKKDRKPWYFWVRNVNEITEQLIDDIANTIINKFTDDNVVLEYKAGEFEKGIVDVCIKGIILFRIIALSCKMRKIKQSKLPDPAGIFMDEYIIDPQTGEKYLKGEAFKIKEIYTTFRREYKGKGVFKMYFCGNPYSLFNPLFLDWKVDINKLKRDSFYVGDFFVIHWAILNPLLRAKLLEENPFYKFDEDYNNYAQEGTAVQDSNIKIAPFPQGYRLQFIFRYDKINVGIYRDFTFSVSKDKFYAKQLTKQEGVTKEIYCFDFAEMCEGSILLSRDERLKLKIFKDAVRTRSISFENINLFYIIKEIYTQL